MLYDIVFYFKELQTEAKRKKTLLFNQIRKLVKKWHTLGEVSKKSSKLFFSLL